MRFLSVLITLILAFSLAACAEQLPDASTPFTPRPSSETKNTFTATTLSTSLHTTPTSTVTRLILEQLPTATIEPDATQTIVNLVTPWAPIQLWPNLIQLVPATNMPLATHWSGPNTLGLYFVETDRETDCTRRGWQYYEVYVQENMLTVATTPLTNDPTCPDEQVQYTTATPWPNVPTNARQISSDPNMRFVFYLLESDSLSASLHFGNLTVGTDDPATWHELWLFDSQSNSHRVLLSTKKNYGYRWLPSGTEILITGQCYGNDLGNGLFTYDLATDELVELSSTYSICEGTPNSKISPDSQYIAFGSSGIIASLDGQQASTICSDQQFARSFAWSADGRYAYVTCSISDRPDALWRFDTESDKAQLMNDVLSIPDELKIQEMSVSPEGDWLEIVWGKSALSGQGQRGLWLLQLAPREISR